MSLLGPGPGSILAAREIRVKMTISAKFWTLKWSKWSCRGSGAVVRGARQVGVIFSLGAWCTDFYFGGPNKKCAPVRPPYFFGYGL